ncbi:MAG: hypothetical protein ACFCUX_01450 [Candidatus Methylacidiphilales bacterium]
MSTRPLPIIKQIGAAWLLLCLAITSTYGQESTPVIFSVELPDGEYRVNVRQVVSVSVHRYLVDGILTVDELTVDTSGNTVARFYVVDRNQEVRAPGGLGQSLIDQAQSKADSLKDRSGVAALIDRSVVKSYPTTTHARTVEYRLGDKKVLMDLFRALSRSWAASTPGKFKVE